MIQLHKVSPRASKKNTTNQGHNPMTAMLDIMHSNYAATPRLHSKETWPSSGYVRLKRNWDLDGSDHGWLDHAQMCHEEIIVTASFFNPFLGDRFREYRHRSRERRRVDRYYFIKFI